MTHSSLNKSNVKEAKNFLKKNPNVESIDIVWHDCNGIGRGKIIRRHELEDLFLNGRKFPLSTLGMDITGEDVPESGLILTTGDGDVSAFPIPGSLKILHNSSPKRGELLMTMFDENKSPRAPNTPKNIQITKKKKIRNTRIFYILCKKFEEFCYKPNLKQIMYVIYIKINY